MMNLKLDLKLLRKMVAELEDSVQKLDLLQEKDLSIPENYSNLYLHAAKLAGILEYLSIEVNTIKNSDLKNLVHFASTQGSLKNLTDLTSVMPPAGSGSRNNN